MAVFNDLDPRFQPWARALYLYAESIGARPRVTSTFRSIREQRRLFEEFQAGRSRFPVARPGNSLHNFGLAFDMVSRSAPFQRHLGQVWDSAGFRWGGNFNDAPHFAIRR